MVKAVVLLSGGLDSATALAIARQQGYERYALSVSYGQRHGSELAAAKNLARSLGVVAHKVIEVDLSTLGGSALIDKELEIPTGGITPGIPSTYVPARNTIMLSLALAWAEALGSGDIFIGVNAIDY